MRNVATGCAIVLAVLATTHIANAQTPDDGADALPWVRGVPEAKRTASLAEYEIGNQAFSQLRYTLALAAYERALALWDNPQIQYNAAVCLMQIDRPLEAYARVVRSLAYGAEPFDGALYQTALLNKKLLRAQLTELTIAVDEMGASITVDGVAAVAGAATMYLAGKRQVVIAKDGFVTQSRTIDLSAGGTLRVAIDLEPPVIATVQRRWAPWIPWTVTGSGLGVASIGVVFHVLALRSYRRYEDALLVECPTGCLPGDIKESVASPHRTADLDRAVAISAYIVGGAAIVTGVALFVFNRKPSVERTAQVVPMGEDGYGVVFGGRF